MKGQDKVAGATIHDFDRYLLQHAHLLPRVLMMGGSRMLGYYGNTVLASPADDTETVVVTTQPFNPPVDSDIVFLFAFLAFTVGTDGVSAKVNIRRGSLVGGTLISSTGAVTIAAADLGTLVCFGVDRPGAVDNMKYSATLTVASGSAASTVSNAVIFALCT